MASYSGDLSEEEQAARAREERQQIVLRWGTHNPKWYKIMKIFNSVSSTTII